MADGVPITPGAGATIDTDEVTRGGTVHQQVMKLALGADGAHDTLVDSGQQTMANSVPVVLPSDQTQIPIGPVKPDGTNTMPSGDTPARRQYVQLTDGTNNVAVSTTGGLEVGGSVAHDATDSGNPMKMGCKAVAHGTNPTAVAAGDRTDTYANRAGVQFVIAGHPNVQTIRLQFTAAQTNAAIITVATGLKIAVTALQVTLDNASTVFPSVRIGFGTASTPTTTGVIAAHGGVPAGGGFSRGDGSGILGIGADDEDLRITTVGVATGGGVEVVVTYFTIES